MTVYLVTDGAGFIGSHIVEALVGQGESVRVVDNFATGKPANMLSFRDQVEFYERDIADPNALKDVMKGVDYVFHQAAIPSVPRSVKDPMLAHEACATGTLNVLVAARDAGVKRLVYAASSSAYGNNDAPYKVETMPTHPLSPYAAAKLAAEMYCQVFYNVYGLQTVALRYFNVFGPRQDPTSPYSGVIPLFATAIMEDRQPTIFGDGLHSRDFTYIENVVYGNLLACHTSNEQVAGQVINLACGDNITLLHLVDDLNRLLGKSIKPIFSDPRPGDVKHSRADITKAGELLGYEPKVSFGEGLAKTLTWLQSEMPSKDRA